MDDTYIILFIIIFNVFAFLILPFIKKLFKKVVCNHCGCEQKFNSYKSKFKEATVSRNPAKSDGTRDLRYKDRGYVNYYAYKFECIHCNKEFDYSPQKERAKKIREKVENDPEVKKSTEKLRKTIEERKKKLGY